MATNFPKNGIEINKPNQQQHQQRDPRMTSMFRRGTIFATFFLSLLGGGLVCAALVTQHWVEAKPWRTPNPQESAGRVHFGLLQGKKELNVAYGWRTYHISGKSNNFSYFAPNSYCCFFFSQLLFIRGRHESLNWEQDVNCCSSIKFLSNDHRMWPSETILKLVREKMLGLVWPRL